MESVKDQRKFLLAIGFLLIIIGPLGVGIQLMPEFPDLRTGQRVDECV